MKDGCNVVDLAYQIINMHNRNERLEEENAELRHYRDLYMEQLDKGISHSSTMLVGMLSLAMIPGVMPAIAEHNKEKQC